MKMSDKNVPEHGLRDYAEPDIRFSPSTELTESWKAGVIAEERKDYEKAIRIFISGRHHYDAISVARLHSLKGYASANLRRTAENYRNRGMPEEAGRVACAAQCLDLGSAFTSEDDSAPEELTDIEFIDGQQEAELPAVGEAKATMLVSRLVNAIHSQINNGNGKSARRLNDMADPEAEKKLRDDYRKGGERAEEYGEYASAIDCYVHAQDFSAAERVARERGMEVVYRSTLIEVAAKYAIHDEMKAMPFRDELNRLKETRKEI
jgi:hypothetical protein